MAGNVMEDTAEVVFGEGVVTVRRKGRLSATAQVLGQQENYPKKGWRTLWLDRVVHEGHEDTMGGYRVTGALVTEMVIPIQVPA